MRCLKRNDRVATVAKWSVHILILAGLLALMSEPVQSQQANRKPTPPRRCTLPAEELESLIILLDDIEQEPEQTSDEETSQEAEPSIEESSTNSSGTARLDPQCTRELTRLRHTLNHLQRSYHQLKQSPITIDERQYQYMENRYAQRKRELTAQLDQLTKQANPAHRSQLNELRRKIVAIEKQLNDSVAKLAEQRQRNVEHFIQLVANNIRDRRIQPAITNFDTLITYNSDPYGAIVGKVYETGNIQNTVAVLNFLRYVDFKHRPVAGYEALVDALINRAALRGPDAVELLKHIQALIVVRDGNQQAQAIALLKKFKSNVH